MEYCFSKKLNKLSFQEAVEKTKEVLKTEGFGVISEIDLAKTLKEKINVDFKKYTILGACSPSFAHQAVLAEDNIGVFLPCNIVITETASKDAIKIAVVNPEASMMAVDNPKLASISNDINAKLQRVLKAI